MARLNSKQVGKQLQHQLLPALGNAKPKQIYGAARHATEKEIQTSILEYLTRCSSIAWANRFTSGKFKVTDRAGTRWIQAGFVGAPDIIGMTTKGRFVAIECKRPRGGVVSAEQIEFLQCVRAGGGIGIIARSVDDVINALR
jgi:hypothetical protein